MVCMRVGRRFFVQFLGAQTAKRQRRDLYIICLLLSHHFFLSFSFAFFSFPLSMFLSFFLPFAKDDER